MTQFNRELEERLKCCGLAASDRNPPVGRYQSLF